MTPRRRLHPRFRKRSLSFGVSAALGAGLASPALADVFDVPFHTTDLIIGSGGGGTQTTATTITSGATITNGGTINNNVTAPGALRNEGFIDNYGGTFNNNSVLTQAGPSSHEIDNDYGGTFNNNAGARLDVFSTFDNDLAVFNNFAGATLHVHGSSGLFLNDDEGTAHNYSTIRNDDDVINYGTFTNHASGVIDNHDDLLNYGSGVFNNFGTINTTGDQIDNDDAATFNNHGTINIAFNAGVSNELDNDGTFVNGADGTINSHDYFVNDRGTFTNHGTINSFGDAEELDNDDAGTFFNHGSINNANYMDNDGALTNETDGVINNFSYFLNDRGDFTNRGLFNNFTAVPAALLGPSGQAGPGSIGIINDSNVVNEGTIRSANDILNTGAFVIASTGVVEGLDEVAALPSLSVGPGTVTFGDFTQNGADSSLVINGRLTARRVVINDGTVGGSGQVFTFDGLEIGENATIGPGNSPGRMDVTGDTTINGLLEIQIEGLTSFDILNVIGGGVAFGGMAQIALSFIGPFVPAFGDSFEFLLADNGITGLDPSRVVVSGLPGRFGAEVRLVGNTLVASVFDAPEPAAASLLGLGLIPLLRRRRGRRGKGGPASA